MAGLWGVGQTCALETCCCCQFYSAPHISIKHQAAIVNSAHLNRTSYGIKNVH